jgi:hypothetical protein
MVGGVADGMQGRYGAGAGAADGVAARGTEALGYGCTMVGTRARARLRGLFARAGDKVECPCCERSFRAFRQASDIPPGAECPACQSRPRHRLLWLYLTRETPIESEHMSVLHFAPEPAITQRLRDLSNLGYVSADLLDPRADVKADITELGFADDSFDLILCSHVLEHVPDDTSAMREMARVLAPGGLAIVQSPVNYDQDGTHEDPSITSPEERLRLFSQADHVRVYGPPDLEHRLTAAGFDVTVSEYADALSPDDVERYGLIPRWGPLRNDLYVCQLASSGRT